MRPSSDRPIRVVGAVIVRDSLVLCAQRDRGAQAGRWEFPGGKVEPGESAAQALRRELAEELGCAVAVGEHVVTTVHEYDAVTVELSTYWCTLAGGEPSAREHRAIAWLAPAELAALPWAAADVPAVERVIAELG